nr:unnamed protein product [Callosobruchus chinensis]
MVHHFVLPDVQKKIARERIVARQRQKLKTIHDAIYNRFEKFLPKGPPRELEPTEIVTDILKEVEEQAMQIVEDKHVSDEEDLVADTMGEISRRSSQRSEALIEEPEEPHGKHYDELLEMYLNELAREADEYQMPPDPESDVTPFDLGMEEQGFEFLYPNDGLETITEVDDSDISQEKRSM